MKSAWLIPAFVCGSLVGWLWNGKEKSPAEPVTVVPKETKERIASSRPDRVIVSFPGDAPPQEQAKQFQAWIGKMNAGNWRDYLIQATSPEAEDRQFLTRPSLESMLFLRKLGEIAPQESIRFLSEKMLDPCVPDVAEGWARVAPTEALAWLLRERYVVGEAGETATARAAAVLLASDPSVVLNGQYVIGREAARELARYAGIKEISSLLDARWNEVSGDFARDSLRCAEFENWSREVVASLTRDGLTTEANKQAVLEWYESFSGRQELNPRIREWLDHVIMRRQSQ